MINQVIISGRITRDLILETRKDKNDENIIRHHVKFSLANTNNFSNRTSYLNC
jgi:single-stranded DNA-binding protein